MNIDSIILAVSGASGALYARRLVDLLDRDSRDVHLIITDAARTVIAHELALDEITPATLLGRTAQRVTMHPNNSLFDPLASGSRGAQAMIVCPCSSHSLAALAGGLADTLLRRAAYVTMKQHRPLVLVHREMPLTAIDLDNMGRLTQAGAIICPATPPFYHHPQGIADLVDAVAGRVLELVGIEHDLAVRFQPEPSS